MPGDRRPREAPRGGYPSEVRNHAPRTWSELPPARVGIAGTGFIARGLVEVLARHPALRLGRVLTRTDAAHRGDFPRRELLTRSIAELVDTSDVVVECSGDVVRATDVVEHVLAAGRPVVTMNSELHVTTGSWFAARSAGRPVFTEAEGDQPGSLAAFAERAADMGFQPLVFGNVKGYLERDPGPQAMAEWAERLGISVRACTAFTDGTKVQIEQALAANGLGATIAREGLLGPSAATIREGAERLGAAAAEIGRPISDFVLAPGAPPGIFLCATHDGSQRAALQYLKLGPGPRYVLVQEYHLVHLEIPRTIARVLCGGGPLLDNSARPEVGVAAEAKRTLEPGERIARGIGSFEVRGRAIRLRERPGHVPIGLLADAVLRRRVPAGELVALDDVELEEGTALRAWREIEARALAGP